VPESRGHEAAWTLQAQAAEFRETLESEKRIAADPAVAAEWTRHQLEVEAEMVNEDENDTDGE